MQPRPPAASCSCYFSIRLFVREVIKISMYMGTLEARRVTRSLKFSVSATKTQRKHPLFKFGLAQ